MNLTDLREVLDERSDATHARTHLVLDGVHERIRVRARRRRTGSVAAATLAILGIGFGTLAVSRAPDAAPPGSSKVTPAPMRTIEGFPEYADGARVIVAKSAHAPARSVSVTFVPTGPEMKIFGHCSASDAQWSTSLNGKVAFSGTNCGGTRLTSLLKEYGMALGRPTVVTMTLTKGSSDDFAVAVGIPVDPAVYPYPPRPAVLTDLELPLGMGTHLVRNDPADPLRPVSSTFRWSSRITQFEARTNTPGELSVRLNGVEILDLKSWDYGVSGNIGGLPEELRAKGLKLTPGQQVTVTVTPQRTTGDWTLMVDE